MTEEVRIPDVVVACCSNCWAHRPRQPLIFYKEMLEDGLRYAGFRCGECKLETQPSYIGLYLENGVMIHQGMTIEQVGSRAHAFE